MREKIRKSCTNKRASGLYLHKRGISLTPVISGIDFVTAQCEASVFIRNIMISILIFIIYLYCNRRQNWKFIRNTSIRQWFRSIMVLIQKQNTIMQWQVEDMISSPSRLPRLIQEKRKEGADCRHACSRSDFKISLSITAGLNESALFITTDNCRRRY